jgi:hypothetical protein
MGAGIYVTVMAVAAGLMHLECWAPAIILAVFALSWAFHRDISKTVKRLTGTTKRPKRVSASTPVTTPGP